MSILYLLHNLINDIRIINLKENFCVENSGSDWTTIDSANEVMLMFMNYLT